jgi:small subunit ribosomal protein S6
MEMWFCFISEGSIRRIPLPLCTGYGIIFFAFPAPWSSMGPLDQREEVTRLMRNYEAMIILQADYEEEARNALVEKLQGLIVKTGGEVTDVNHWGTRKLAYEINDLRDGYYLLIKFTGEGTGIGELERNLKITDGVLRFLVIREGE